MIEPANVEHCTHARSGEKTTVKRHVSLRQTHARDTRARRTRTRSPSRRPHCPQSGDTGTRATRRVSRAYPRLLSVVCVDNKGAIGKKNQLDLRLPPPYQHPPTSSNPSNSRLPRPRHARRLESNGLDGRRLKEHLRPRPNKLTMRTTGGLRFVLGLPPAAPACAYCEYSHGKVLPVSTACVTAPPKANIASRPLASSFICISSFFAGSEMKPIGSKPVAARDGAGGAGRGKGATRCIGSRCARMPRFGSRLLAAALPFAERSDHTAAPKRGRTQTRPHS